MVARAVPDAWGCATPADLLEARLGSMDAALCRVLGDDVVTSPTVHRAVMAVGAVPPHNNMGFPWPASPG